MVRAEVERLETTVVEPIRGLKFKAHVNVVVLDEQSFKDRIGAEVDKSKTEIEAQGTTAKALGLVPPDTDYFAEYRKIFTDYVVGLYLPDSKELLVKGSEITDHERVTLAHLVERARQLRAIRLAARGRLLENPLAPLPLQRVALQRGVLVCGRNAGVAD